MKRRRFLEIGLGTAAAGAFLPLTQWTSTAWAGGASAPSGAAGSLSATPLLSVAHGPSAPAITRAAIDALGGMSSFVKRGDRVVVKPNIGWDRTPEQAACTNPEVVATIVRMCVDAGAKTVLVLDNTCNDPRRCYVRSGIADAVKAAGGKVDFFEEERAKKMSIGGEKVHEWLVHPAFVERDVLINVPIAKHHGLAGITLGMKNWLGAIGGPRNRLHQEMDFSVVDLGAFFKPQLTVIDGVRILTKGGPQGGSLDDVRRLDTVIASADMVAAEARGAALHGRTVEEVPHIAMAVSRGLGRSSWQPGEERAVEVPGS
jgi:uncharacterized protein (DUF362 family)